MVVLKPNPALSQSQCKVIADDFDMTDEQITLSNRKSLLFYWKKQLRIDVAACAGRSGRSSVSSRHSSGI